MPTAGNDRSSNGEKNRPAQSQPQKPPDHVVVFVHGMGRALKGGTLQEWAQPLMQSLYDLSLEKVPDAPAAPLLIDSANAVGDAPKVWVRVLRSYTEGKPTYIKVLMTEASWDSDFAPATATATYMWSLKMAALVYRRSLSLIWWSLYPGRDKWSPWWWVKGLRRILLSGMVLLVGLPMLGVILTALFFVILLAKIPGPGRWVGGLVLLFADFLGDPEVWRQKPMQAAAMRQRVRDTLTPWHDNEDVEVTVVAHSQGAAISGQVLFQGETRPRVNNFISVGNGLDLLGYAKWGGPETDPVSDWFKNSSIRWINVWGTFDFVPAGPISTIDPPGRKSVFRKIADPGYPREAGNGPEEHPVYNRSALIYDHIVYSRNRIELLDPLARLLLCPGDGPVWLECEAGDKRLKPHRVLVKSLGVTRALAIATSVLIAPAVLSLLGSLGWARDLVQCRPDGTTPWWSLWLCSGSGYHWGNRADWWVLGAAAIVLAAIFIGLLNGMLWPLLHGRVERYGKGGRPSRGKPYLMVGLYLAASAALTVALPLAVVRDHMIFSFVYFTVAALLWLTCFTGNGRQPLAARPPWTKATAPPA